MATRPRRPLPAAFVPQPAAALPDWSRLFLRTVRLWVLLACRGRCPMAAAHGMLGPAALAFARLMDAALADWPEPFTSHPPCAPYLSPDEALLTGLFTAAAADRPAEAQALLADFAAADRRELLWACAAALAAELAPG